MPFSLFQGEMAALVAGVAFLVIERLRLSTSLGAALEAYRLWGLMALSVLSFWVAGRLGEPVTLVGVAIVTPIASALLINNSYDWLRRVVARPAS